MKNNNLPTMFAVLFLFSVFNLAHSKETISEQLSNNSDTLKSMTFQQKLLPQPAGIGGENSYFGSSVDVDGDRAIIAAEGMIRHGMAYIYEFDGNDWVRQHTLIPSNSSDIDNFGHSVSISGDLAVVGAARPRWSGQNYLGRVYAFKFDGQHWNEIQIITPADISMGDRFGVSVSLQGTRLAVGAIEFGNGGSGYAVIYEYDGINWVEGQTIRSLNPVNNDVFGNSISLDDNRLLVGAPGRDDNGASSGAAYVFELNNNSWNQVTQLLPTNGYANDNFGYVVSLSGEVAVVGSPFNDDEAASAGTVHVFQLDNGNWSEAAQLYADNADISDRFGISVSIENNTIAIGATNGGSIDGGSVYLFQSTNNVWQQINEFIPAEATWADAFGSSVAIAGEHIMIGAITDRTSGLSAGSAYALNFNEPNWQILPEINSDEGAAFDYFGHSISADGNWLFVGARGDDDFDYWSGAVYVYHQDGNQWSFVQKLTSSDPSYAEYFGYSVSVYGDRAIIGSVGSMVSGSDNGVAYIFEYNGNQWTETSRIEPADGHLNNYFGSAVSLFQDRALIGASKDDENGNESGAAYVFELVNGNWIQTAKLIANGTKYEAQFGIAVDLYGDTAVIGSSLDSSYGADAGSAEVFEYDGVNWQLAQVLIPANGAGTFYEWFGHSVSVYENKILVGAPGDGYNFQGTGKVYQFEKQNNTWSQNKVFEPNNGVSQGQYGYSVKLSNNNALISVLYGGQDSTNGAAFLFDYSNNYWLLNTTVEHTGAGYERFGSAVELNNDTAMIGADADDDHGTESGSVTIYQVTDDLIFINGFN